MRLRGSSFPIAQRVPAMTRLLSTSFLVISTAAALAVAQTKPPATEPTAKAAPTTASPQGKTAAIPLSVSALLNKRVESVDWDETPLENVVEDWLQEQGNINVVVRWRSLEAEGFTRDTPVSLKMRNATVGQILKEALEVISGGGEAGVRYRGMGNTLQISTRSDFNSKLYTKTYDIGDLMFRVPNFTDGPQIQLTQQGGGSGGGGQGGIGTTTGQIFTGDQEEEDNEDRDELDQQRIDEMVEMIKQTIEPDSWQDLGGKGTIVGFRRTIVVRNTLEVHEKLGGPFETE